MADQSGVPQVDFSILGNLGNTYSEAQQLTLADLGRKKASEALARGDSQGALSALVGSGDARTLAALGQYQAGANSVYGTPIYGTDDKGNTRVGSFDKSGRFRPIETPGFNPTPGIKAIDTGTGTMIIGSRTGQPIGGVPQPMGAPQSSGGQVLPSGQPAPVQQPTGAPRMSGGYIPKDVEGEARAKKYGAEIGDRQADLGKAKSALDNGVANLDALQVQANEVLNHPGLSRITGVPGMLPNVPGFPGADAQAKLETLKSKVGFAALQAMRDASKTGGALGQVSDFENKNLQNSMVELQNAQSEKQIKVALRKLVLQVNGVKDRLQQAYETDYAGIPRPRQQPQAPAQAAPSQPVTRTLGGKNYIQVNGDWFEQ